MSKDILIAGDIHACWAGLNSFINSSKPNMMICCGDFGFWPRESDSTITRLKNNNTRIHWCDGNHEDFWSLKGRSSNEIHPNVFYQPRGSVLTLPDGRNILFFGGAHSVDKDVRTLGKDWFPEEVPSYADFEKLDEITCKIDQTSAQAMGL
jgi:hypothetical protein